LIGIERSAPHVFQALQAVIIVELVERGSCCSGDRVLAPDAIAGSIVAVLDPIDIGAGAGPHGSAPDQGLERVTDCKPKINIYFTS